MEYLSARIFLWDKERDWDCHDWLKDTASLLHDFQSTNSFTFYKYNYLTWNRQWVQYCCSVGLCFFLQENIERVFDPERVEPWRRGSSRGSVYRKGGCSRSRSPMFYFTCLRPPRMYQLFVTLLRRFVVHNRHSVVGKHVWIFVLLFF